MKCLSVRDPSLRLIIVLPNLYIQPLTIGKTFYICKSFRIRFFYFVILILIYFYGNLILSHEFCLIELICYHKHYLRQIKSDLRVNLIYQV